MTAVPFYTLRLARDLRDKAKLSPEQAEGMVDALAGAMETTVATKADVETSGAALRREIVQGRTEPKAEIAELRSELKADIADLRNELRTEIKGLRAEMQALEQRMTIRLGTMMVVAVGAVATLVRFL